MSGFGPCRGCDFGVDTCEHRYCQTCVSDGECWECELAEFEESMEEEVREWKRTLHRQVSR